MGSLVAWGSAVSIIMVTLLGCVSTGQVQSPTMSVGTATTDVSVAATLEATSPSPEPTRGPEEEGGRLVARRVDVPPAVDGAVDAVWASALPLRVPLTWGRDGTEQAMDVELRALYADQQLFLLAQWPEAKSSRAGGEANADAVYSKFLVHWREDPIAPSSRTACTVACHTAYADYQGSVAYMLAETVPPAYAEPLLAAGSWYGGSWIIEWSRPLVTDNAFDVQFVDLRREVSFLVKVFVWVDGRPDAVSKLMKLAFEP